jgi:hypothetical protein
MTIPIRRGLCNLCGKTFTFLPPVSPPYSHYSLIARSQALQRYFVERRGWEAAAPTFKDPQRVTIHPLCADGFEVWIPLGHHFRSYAPRCTLSLKRWMQPGFSLWAICGCAGKLYSLVLIGSGLCGSKKTEPPTIFAWECGLPSPTLDSGGKTAPWARIWNGSNSAFRCWNTCNGTTGLPAPPVLRKSLLGCVPCIGKAALLSMSCPARICSTVTDVGAAAI